jgi:hypothetical protein
MNKINMARRAGELFGAGRFPFRIHKSRSRAHELPAPAHTFVLAGILCSTAQLHLLESGFEERLEARKAKTGRVSARLLSRPLPRIGQCAGSRRAAGRPFLTQAVSVCRQSELAPSRNAAPPPKPSPQRQHRPPRSTHRSPRHRTPPNDRHGQPKSRSELLLQTLRPPGNDRASALTASRQRRAVAEFPIQTTRNPK